MWLDGVCKKCGSLVIEGPALESPWPRDYQNMCLNKECEEHKWHFIYDNEELNYYIHDSQISKRIIIKEK